MVHLARLRGNKEIASSLTPWGGDIEKEIRLHKWIACRSDLTWPRGKRKSFPELALLITVSK